MASTQTGQERPHFRSADQWATRGVKVQKAPGNLKLVQVVRPAMGNSSAIGIVGMAHPAIIPADRGLYMLDPENIDDLEKVEALLFTEAELEECIGGNIARMGHGYSVDQTCLATTKRGRRCLNPPLVGRPFCALHGGR